MLVTLGSRAAHRARGGKHLNLASPRAMGIWKSSVPHKHLEHSAARANTASAFCWKAFENLFIRAAAKHYYLGQVPVWEQLK